VRRRLITPCRWPLAADRLRLSAHPAFVPSPRLAFRGRLSRARDRRSALDDALYFDYIGIMVEGSKLDVGSVIAGLTALAQETRLAAFRRLLPTGSRGLPQGALARDLGVPAQTLSFHLRQMSAARIVTSRREGTTIRYAVDFESVRRLAAYLTESCCSASPARERRRGRA
jgi:ArsR family transcriptional regulator